MRTPDFLIIGARKSGTTSLYAWLAAQPELFLPANKEPQFFSHDEEWNRGLAWYGSLFDEAAPGQLVGEASVNYTNPRYAAVAAQRIAATAPAVRLIFVARHPVERLRSHYRHAVQRRREQRPLAEAVREPGNRYVSQSLYHTCLAPYFDGFDPAQLHVARFEDLFGPPTEDAWHGILGHLGLDARPSPRSQHNASNDKAQFSPALRVLWERGFARRLERLPTPLRRAGKRLLTSNGTPVAARLAASSEPLPTEVTEPLFEDAARLAERLGLDRPLWDPAVPTG